MNIDFSQLITAEDKAAGALPARIEAAKAECRRRILAVADETAQMNMASAASAGLLMAEQMAVWQSALGWVAAMRAAWAVLVESGADLSDDTNWPDLPPGVAELAAAF